MQKSYKNEDRLIRLIMTKVSQIPNISTDLISNDNIITSLQDLRGCMCNYDLINKIYKRISFDGLEFYKSSKSMSYYSQYYIQFLYYYKVEEYIQNCFKIFSLGDSLDKLNIFWNIMNIDKQIINIPLSGSMYTQSPKAVEILE